MEHQADDDGDVLMELACTDDFEEHSELTTEREQEQKNLEDKVCWADESDEPEFRDDRTGRPLDLVKVRAAREEELKELERRVFVEADVEECVRVTGKKPIGVRWVDVDKGFGVYRNRLVAKDFRPNSRVDDVQGLCGATLPLELVRLLLTNAAASSQGHAHRHWESALVRSDRGGAGRRPASRASKVGEVCETPLHALWAANRTQQLGERVHENSGGSGVRDGTCDGMRLLPR